MTVSVLSFVLTMASYRQVENRRPKNGARDAQTEYQLRLCLPAPFPYAPHDILAAHRFRGSSGPAFVPVALSSQAERGLHERSPRACGPLLTTNSHSPPVGTQCAKTIPLESCLYRVSQSRLAVIARRNDSSYSEARLSRSNILKDAAAVLLMAFSPSRSFLRYVVMTQITNERFGANTIPESFPTPSSSPGLLANPTDWTD
jgi:hypothetical protein